MSKRSCISLSIVLILSFCSIRNPSRSFQFFPDRKFFNFLLIFLNFKKKKKLIISRKNAIIEAVKEITIILFLSQKIIKLSNFSLFQGSTNYFLCPLLIT